MKRYVCILVVFFTLLGATSTLQGSLAYFSFSDPVGDHTGNTDLTGMDVTFDTDTGEYSLLLTAHADNPFQGDFRININLYNPDTPGGTDPDYSFFQDNEEDNIFSASSPALTWTLTGTSSQLTYWEIGDRVAANSLPFGNPSGSSSFRSSVRNWDTQANAPEGSGINEAQDILACNGWYSDPDDSNTSATRVLSVPVPLPGAVLLGGVGAGLIGWLRRRRAV